MAPRKEKTRYLFSTRLPWPSAGGCDPAGGFPTDTGQIVPLAPSTKQGKTMIDTPEQVARNICASAGAYESDAEDLRHWTEVIAARDADIRAEAVPIVDAACELVAAICKAADWADGTRVADAIDKLDALLSPPAAERSDP